MAFVWVFGVGRCRSFSGFVGFFLVILELDLEFQEEFQVLLMRGWVKRRFRDLIQSRDLMLLRNLMAE